MDGLCGAYYFNIRLFERLTSMSSPRYKYYTNVPLFIMITSSRKKESNLVFRQSPVTIMLSFLSFIIFSIKMFQPFERKNLPNGQPSQFFVISRVISGKIMGLSLIIMILVMLLQAILLVVTSIIGCRYPTLCFIAFGKEKKENFNLVGMCGFQILQWVFLILISFGIKNHHSIVLSVKDCYHWMVVSVILWLISQKSTYFLISQELMEIIGITSTFIVIDLHGLSLMVVIVLCALSDISLFRKFAPRKSNMLILVSLTAQVNVILIMISFIFKINIDSENSTEQLTKQIEILIEDFNMDYKEFEKIVILLLRNQNLRLIMFIIFAILSAYIANMKQLGTLGGLYFGDDLLRVPSNKPQEEFEEIMVNDMENFKNKSKYINFFIKKICRIMDIPWKESLTVERNLQDSWLSEIPFLSQSSLIQKIMKFQTFSNKINDFTGQTHRILYILIKIVKNSAKSFMNFGTMTFGLLLLWVIFFLLAKHYIPTIFTFIILLGVCTLGIVSFTSFFHYSQLVIVLPLAMNLIISYTQNTLVEQFDCKVEQARGMIMDYSCFMIYSPVSIIWGEQKLISTSFTAITVLNVILFKWMIIIYRMYTKSRDYFKVKNEEKIREELKKSFKSDKIPVVHMFIIMIGGNFKYICYVILLLVGTHGATLVNIILIVFLLTFVTSQSFANNHWNIFYLTLYFILILGFILDILIDQNYSQKENSFNEVILYIGLPSWVRDELIKNYKVDFELNNFNIRSSYNQYIILICCSMIQQLTSRSLFLRIAFENFNSRRKKSAVLAYLGKVFDSVKSWFMRLYYILGVEIAYFIIIILSFMQAITFARWILITFLLVIIMFHLQAMRSAVFNKRTDLSLVKKLWKIFLLLKIFVAAMIIIGSYVL